MKRYRNTIILLVVLGLFVGAYAILNNKSTDDGEGNDSGEVSILNLDRDKIVEMTIENGEDTLVFVKENVKVKENDTEVEKKVWKISSPKDFRIDSSQVDSIEINVSTVKAEKIVEENSSDFAQYGLDKPVTITVKMDDGTVYAIELGNETPTKSGFYAKEKGSGRVFIIDTYTGNKLKAGINDVRDKRLFTVSSDEITGLSFERDGQLVFSSKKIGDSQWEMTTPLRGNMDIMTVSTMLNALTQATVKEYIEANAADLGKYGLTKPAYAVEFETVSGKGKLLLGKENNKGEDIFAMVDDSTEVVTLPIDGFTFLDKPLEEIIEKFAYLVHINNVSKIVVDMDGETIVSELQTNEDDPNDDKFFVDGKDVTTLKNENGDILFKNYYQALIGITFDGIEIEAVPSRKAEITFTYHLNKAPNVMKVEFVPKNDKYYYLLRNGEYTGLIIEKEQFDKPEGVRDAYKKLSEAMEKQK
jgi:hypothetical protein